METAIAQSCPKCKKAIVDGDVAVLAPICDATALWHPSCFTCATCDELLVRM